MATPAAARSGRTPAPETPAVTFAEARRPEVATLVHLPAFDGPLGLLLALIEQRQLDVLTVPLGVLAGAYLEALATLEGPLLPHLSAFVAVASQLILIKSRALLPAPPQIDEGEEDDRIGDPEADLRRRLVLYRAFRDAAAWLGSRLDGPRLFRREPGPALATGLAGAQPATDERLDPGQLTAALAALARIVPPPAEPPGLVRRTITVAERAAAIREALRGAPVIVLQDLLAGGRDRRFVVVTFLAMLELVKRREIAVEQRRPWGPIRCRAIRTAGTWSSEGAPWIPPQGAL